MNQTNSTFQLVKLDTNTLKSTKTITLSFPKASSLVQEENSLPLPPDSRFRPTSLDIELFL